MDSKVEMKENTEDNNIENVINEEDDELTEQQLEELNQLGSKSDDPFQSRSIASTTTTTTTTTASNEDKQVEEIKESIETLTINNNKTTDTANRLVIDTNAIISWTKFENIAKELYTIPEVLEEVIDESSNDFLSSFPFEIKTREPTPESIKAVIDFSIKTGDYPSLSATDIKVIALTYTLEAEVNGITKIKTSPNQILPQTNKNNNQKKKYKNKNKNKNNTNTNPNAIGGNDKPKANNNNKNKKNNNNNNKKKENKPCDHNHQPKNEEIKPIESNTTTTTTTTTTNSNETTELPSQPTTTNTELKQTIEVSTQPTQPITTETTTPIETSQPIKKSKKNSLKVNLDKLDEEVAKEKFVDPKEVLEQFKQKQREEEEERRKKWQYKQEDEGDWISPHNIGNLISPTHTSTVKKHFDVGCITRDFSMQNVIIQMGLNLISVDGLVIKQVKQFVLKCVACENFTTEMTRKFCEHCGNSSLFKAHTYFDRNGILRVSRGSAKQFNLRGTIYSIPKQKGGKHNTDIVLTEDQYLRRLKVTGQFYKQKKEDNEYDLGFSTPTMPNSNVVIGYGNKNPNSARKKIGKKNKSISLF